MFRWLEEIAVAIDELHAARASGHGILEIFEWTRAKRRDHDEWNEPRVEPGGLEYPRIRIVQPLVVLFDWKRRHHGFFHVIYLENPVPVRRAARHAMHVRIEPLQLRVRRARAAACGMCRSSAS